jgi:hypothetical protein
MAIFRKKVRRKLRKLFSGGPEFNFQTTTLPVAPGVAQQHKRIATEEEWHRVYWPGKDFVEPKIRSKISVFRLPWQHKYYIRDHAMAWGRRTTSGVDVYMVDGDHLRMLREPAVANLAAKLTQALELANGAGNNPKAGSTVDPVLTGNVTVGS